MNILKSEIKLFVISQKLSEFLGQYCILSYLFAYTLFKFGSICSLFMVATICFISFSFKKSSKLNHFLTKKLSFIDQGINEYFQLKMNSVLASNFRSS
jgi:hypothetical protein